MATTAPFFCECKSWCNKSVQLPPDVALEIIQKGYIVIVEGCENGPSSGYRLVEQRDDYAVYQES